MPKPYGRHDPRRAATPRPGGVAGGRAHAASSLSSIGQNPCPLEHFSREARTERPGGASIPTGGQVTDRLAAQIHLQRAAQRVDKPRVGPGSAVRRHAERRPAPAAPPPGVPRRPFAGRARHRGERFDRRRLGLVLLPPDRGPDGLPEDRHSGHQRSQTWARPGVEPDRRRAGLHRLRAQPHQCGVQALVQPRRQERLPRRRRIRIRAARARVRAESFRRPCALADPVDPRVPIQREVVPAGKRPSVLPRAPGRLGPSHRATARARPLRHPRRAGHAGRRGHGPVACGCGGIRQNTGRPVLFSSCPDTPELRNLPARSQATRWWSCSAPSTGAAPVSPPRSRRGAARSSAGRSRSSTRHSLPAGR